MLAVASLELDVAADVDEVEIEGMPSSRLVDDLEGTVTEVASRRVVDRDGPRLRWVRRGVRRCRQG